MHIKFTGSKKVLYAAFFLSIGLCIICAAAACLYIGKVSHFTEVSAQVVDVACVYDNQSRNKQNRNKYIKYEYQLDGNKYTGQRLTLFAGRRIIGRKVVIKVNPEKPDEIGNNLYVAVYAFVIILCAAVCLLAAKVLFK